MIEKEKVKYILSLGRLEIEEEEIEKFQKDFSQILDYLEKLKEVDVSKVKPTFYPIEISGIKRKDKPSKEYSSPEKLLRLMPKVKNGYLKTKPIFS